MNEYNKSKQTNQRKKRKQQKHIAINHIAVNRLSIGEGPFYFKEHTKKQHLNIVLKININSSSSANRGEDTGDLDTLSEFYQQK